MEQTYSTFLVGGHCGVWRNASPSTPKKWDAQEFRESVFFTGNVHESPLWGPRGRCYPERLSGGAGLWKQESHRKASDHVQCLPASSLCWWLFSTEKGMNRQETKQRKGKGDTAQIRFWVCCVLFKGRQKKSGKRCSRYWWFLKQTIWALLGSQKKLSKILNNNNNNKIVPALSISSVFNVTRLRAVLVTVLTVNWNLAHSLNERSPLVLDSTGLGK